MDLRFGDTVILKCQFEQRTYFLLCCGEQCVLESPSGEFRLYGHVQQLEFKIFPRLLHDAQKKYTKSNKSLKGATQEIQNQLLFKRMETEKQYNQDLLTSSKGQVVKYGDVIMLYHPLSQVFFQNGEGKHSEILTAEMYYTVRADPMSLDKEGTPVKNTDQFLLIQNEHCLKFDNMLELPHLREINKSTNFDHDIRFLTVPNIIENQYAFKFYKAQHKSIVQDTNEYLSLNTIQAIQVPNRQSDNLHYGDHIRIKYYKSIKNENQDKKKTLKDEISAYQKGYLTSSINAIGCFPQVFMQTNDAKEFEPMSSIFEVVPDNDCDYGSPIILESKGQIGFSKLLLRHSLTGMYLRINPKTQTLDLSAEYTTQYRQFYSKHISEKQSVYKNLSALKLYHQVEDQKLQTQPNQQEALQCDKLIFIQKLMDPEEVPFTFNTIFEIANKEGSAVLAVEQSEDIYEEKLMAKNEMFNYYSLQQADQILKREFREEWFQLMPDLEYFQKKLKIQMALADKSLIEYLEKEEKIQSQRRVEVGHFKSNEETFRAVFINLNPLKTYFMDVKASEFGSKFMLEPVDTSEVEQLNEIQSFIFPIILLAKHPQQLTSMKYKILGKLTPLQTQFINIQKQAVQNIEHCVKALHRMMLWLCDSSLEQSNELTIQDPLPERQLILREVGIIDYVNKILYELHINGQLYSFDAIKDDELIDQELNQLIDAISTFLQVICKNNFNNSLYTVQWYYLYKDILLNPSGSLSELMRLDLLLTQLFQKTDINISFQSQVADLAKNTKYSKYNKHAYNLLLAFCLHTTFRKKDAVEELIDYIFQQNRDTIFAPVSYQGVIQLCLNDQYVAVNRQSQSESTPKQSDDSLHNRQQLNEYLISCIRLASEMAKSSPALCLKFIKKIVPFKSIVAIIQDPSLMSLTKFHFMELFHHSYISKHMGALPIIDFPQFIKTQSRQQYKSGIFGTKYQSNVKLYIFEQQRLKDLYKKNSDRYLSENGINLWEFMKEYIASFWQTKTIYEVKNADHQFIRQLLVTFIYILKRGVFITYLQDPNNFYTMYHRFIEFLKNSVVSAHLEELYLKDQIGNNSKNQLKQQEIREYLFEDSVKEKKSIKQGLAKSITWMDELIDILVLLEKYYQSRVVDQFIEVKENYLIFDELRFLQRFTSNTKYKEMMERLKSARKSQYEARTKRSNNQVELKETLSYRDLTGLLRQSSYERKSIIIEYMRGLRQSDPTMVYFLIELLTFNQSKLSASVTELLWEMYSAKSIFLSTINQTLLLDSQDDQQTIFTEFSSIYWKIHFALTSFEQASEEASHKHFEAVNDALSDILVIFYPDYAAKSDMQLYLEINLLENEEKHYQAHEEKMVKSKLKHEQITYAEPRMSRNELDVRSDNVDQFNNEQQSLKEDNNNHTYLWKVTNSLSIDVQTVYNRQRILRYLDFHKLVERVIGVLIKENSTLFQDKINKNKGWEIKSEILEKSILFLIYFVIKNQENQELILLADQKYLHQMTTSVKKKQLQTLIFILFAELFRDNYNIVFSMERYLKEDSLVSKLFNSFGQNLQQKNYEQCVYFMQLAHVFIRVRESDVVQNNQMIVQMFKQKSLVQFAKDFNNLVGILYLQRIEQKMEMSTEMVLIIEVIRLLQKIGQKRTKLIDEFINKVLPIKLVSEMMSQLDEWYPLKSELLTYFRLVFLENALTLASDVKPQIRAFINEVILRLLAQQNDAKPRSRLQNNTFNIFNIRNQYSTYEYIISTDYTRSYHFYLIYGLIEVMKVYVAKVNPRFFNDERDYFDDEAKTDLLFQIPQILDAIEKIREIVHQQERQKKSSRQQSSGKKPKNFQLTQKLLQGNQEDQVQDSIRLPEEENEDAKNQIMEVYEMIKSLQLSELGFNLMRNEISQYEQKIITKWENVMQSQMRQIIDDHVIIQERENELQQLVNLIVTLKRDDTNKFKLIIASLIQILSEDTIAKDIKLKSITIIRKLSNYKDNLSISQGILKDLSELGFTDFLCDLIKSEPLADQRLEYVKAFVEYIDDSSKEIQTSFLTYLRRDPQNLFIQSMQSQLNDLFSDLKMSEQSNFERKDTQITRIMNAKINGCIYIIELFRLGCEDHFTEMQDFLREQNNKNSINLIEYLAELFKQYTEFMNEYNAPLGSKILDFLIESVQGPCLKNQLYLTHKTSILEVLEQIIIQHKVEATFQKRDVVFSNLRSKIFLLQLSLMEGNGDMEIAQRISQYFNPQILVERIQLVYWKIIKKIKNTSIETNIEVRLLSRLKTMAGEVQNTYGIIQTRNTKETSPNFELFQEYFTEADLPRQVSIGQVQKINNISEEDLGIMVDESFTMYLLLKKITLYLPELQQFDESNVKLTRALKHYQQQTASIEIVNMNGQLERIFFQLPILMFYLTNETKLKFMLNVSRDSINDKINGLMDNFTNFYMEMVHFMKLRKIGIKYNNHLVVAFRNIAIIVAMIINLLIIINQSELNVAIMVLGAILILLYAVMLIIWISVRLQLEYAIIQKDVADFIKLNYFSNETSQQSQDELVIVYSFSITVLQNLLIIKKMIFESYASYWSILLLLSLLGELDNLLFFGFVLLDIIDHSPVLKNVVKAISQNYQSLVMTGVLGLLLMYLYSLVAYQNVQFTSQLVSSNQDPTNNPMDNKVCYTQFQCWVFLIHYGLRAGGGIGDALQPPPFYTDLNFYSERFFFDVSFFLMINIIWLNIIFGIIIDTFAELRDDKTQKDFDRQNRCYICGLSRTVFEKEGVSFDKHIEKQHNPWNYLAYMIHLKVKVKTELTGLESYVQRKIERNDISWLPIEKALDLQQISTHQQY